MFLFQSFFKQGARLLLVVFCGVQSLAAQQAVGTLRGQVTDQLDAVVVGAIVSVTDAKGATRTTNTMGDGNFVIGNLPPGHYTVYVSATGFAVYQNPSVEIAAGSRVTLDIKLNVTIAEQKVAVPAQAPVSTEPDNNASAIVLRGQDLNALPEDPDELANVLRALAGPSAGPNGAQFYVDGFTGGRLPSRDMIREIRINQNPFSAEYDRLGFGRIEIITRPGTDKFHGNAVFGFSDESLNSRNPFALKRAPYQSRLYGGNLSGPLLTKLAKRATFFLGATRRELDDNAVINATVLDAALRLTPFSRAVVTPQRALDFSPRLDFQLTPNHTLSARYGYLRSRLENAGIGDFSLLSRAYKTATTSHILRLTENAILSARAVNETRFQYIHDRRRQEGDNTTPAINVLEAFLGGGAQVGRAVVAEDRWELHHYTTWSLGLHTMKIGGRLRGVTVTDSSPTNFGGTYTFAGGTAPQLNDANQIVRDANNQPVFTTITSIERYRRTLLFQQRTPIEIRALGGGATQLSIAGGNPEVAMTQVDFGGFLHDDWRLRPHFTLSLGLRYETQNNISDRHDVAPRVAFAWSPWVSKSGQSKTVLRGGFGLFYERFSESFTLQARRYNGVNQQQYVVSDSSVLDLFPNVPSTSQLAAFAQPQTWRRVAADLRTPYTLQSAISLERQLPRNVTLSLSYLNARTLHLLRSRNVNAPLPNGGARPLGNIGNVLAYESGGIFKQQQLIVNASQRLSTGFTLMAVYTLNQARSDTDGALSFPANTYDLRGEFGRSALDVRHQFFLGGALNAPWGISFNPLVVLRSGAPFNITIGRDANGDTLFTERPAFADDLVKPGVIHTRFGAFDPNPSIGQRLIPRNFAEGPGFFSVNLAVRKRIGLGSSPKTAVASAPAKRNASADKPYGLTFALQAQNLFNRVNPGVPIGNLSSPLFGRSNTTATGGFSFGGGAPATSNRRVEMQLIFTF